MVKRNFFYNIKYKKHKIIFVTKIFFTPCEITKPYYSDFKFNPILTPIDWHITLFYLSLESEYIF